MEVILHTTKDTQELAQSLSTKLSGGTIVLLYGELAAGKTTFIKYLTEALGSTDRVQSPTFVLLRQYKTNTLTINHLDLYRIKAASEVNDLGMVELFEDTKAVTLIEWPEVLESTMNLANYENRIMRLKFSHNGDDTRTVTITESKNAL